MCIHTAYISLNIILKQWFSNWGSGSFWGPRSTFQKNQHDAPEEKNFVYTKFSGNLIFQTKLKHILSYGSLILLWNQTVILAKVGTV